MVSDSVILSLVYLSSLLDILSMPVLVLGFKVPIISATSQLVIGWNCRLQFGLLPK